MAATDCPAAASLLPCFLEIMELPSKKIEVFSLSSLQKGQCYFGKAARKPLKQPKYVLQLKEALSLVPLLCHHFFFVGTSFCAAVCGYELGQESWLKLIQPRKQNKTVTLESS